MERSEWPEWEQRRMKAKEELDEMRKAKDNEEQMDRQRRQQMSDDEFGIRNKVVDRSLVVFFWVA